MDFTNTTGQDTTDATDATRPDTTGAEVVVSVAEAARLLGVSEGAIRKRIERGQLRAAKFKNQWQITLGPNDRADATVTVASRQDATRPDTTKGGPVAVAPAAVAQLEAIRDQWLAPLVAQIREQAEQIGRLAAEREAVVRERDDLTARLAGDRGLADQLVDVLQAERDDLAARVRAFEALGAGEVVVGHPTASPEGPGAAPPVTVTPDASRSAPSRWATWWRRVVGENG